VGLAGGVFFVPLLIYILKINPKEAVATSFLVIVFSSLSGFSGYFLRGAANLSLVLPLFIFVFLGAQLGSRLMLTRLSGTQVKKLFGILLLIIVLRLLRDIF
jgi:uncharacterized membrane protein YfcA